MLAEAKSRKLAVVMMGVPKPGLLFMTSAPVYQAIDKRNDIVMDLDTLPAILGKNDMKSAMVHLNDADYRQMVTQIFNLLKAAGAV